MDEELKIHLDTTLSAMERRLEARIDKLEDRMDHRFEAAARATAADIGALHTDIRQVEARLSARMDEYHNRANRHAALLQTGARQIVRIFDNEEELSRLWRDLEKRQTALEREFRNGSGTHEA